MTRFVLVAVLALAVTEPGHAQLGNPEFTALSSGDRLRLLVDAEWTQRKRRRRLRQANLCRPRRARGLRLAQPRHGLDRDLVHSLATCAWIGQRRNLLLIRPIGIGKPWLGEAFGERASTLITSQVPVKGWHDLIGEPTHADAICDRLIHTAYVIELQGPSLRETRVRAQ